MTPTAAPLIRHEPVGSAPGLAMRIRHMWLRSANDKLENLRDFVQTLDYSMWIKLVFGANAQHVAFPRVVVAYPSPYRIPHFLTYKGDDRRAQCSLTTSTSSLRELTDDERDLLFDTQFLIVRVLVDETRYEFPATTQPNHVFDIYYFRHEGGPETPWRSVVCDPNYKGRRRGHDCSDSGGCPAARTYAAVADGVLKGLSGEHLDRRHPVELHRCINLNVCLPSSVVKEGVCFAALCAVLFATAAFSVGKPPCRDGACAVDRMLDATGRGRAVASELIKSAMSRRGLVSELVGVPDTQLHEASHHLTRAPARSQSPRLVTVRRPQTRSRSPAAPLAPKA